MFRESSAIDSERTANSIRSLYAKYSADENWFTGTPDSVDRRIAQTKKIANAAKAACVRLSGRNVVGQYIALAHEMDGDRVALEGLRRDLLTASSDREDYEDHRQKLQRKHDDTYAEYRDSVDDEPVYEMHARDPHINPDGHHTSNKHVEYQEGFGHTIEKTRDPGDYEGKHRVEARYFIAEQECNDLRELTIRAQHFAERISSTLPTSQSAKFVRSFVEAVRDEYEPPRQQRTAASNYVTPDFPAELFYMD